MPASIRRSSTFLANRTHLFGPAIADASGTASSRFGDFSFTLNAAILPTVSLDFVAHRR